MRALRQPWLHHRTVGANRSFQKSMATHYCWGNSGVDDASSRSLGRWSQAMVILQSGTGSQLCVGHWAFKRHVWDSVALREPTSRGTEGESSDAGLPDSATQEELGEGENTSRRSFSKSKSWSKARFGMGIWELTFDKYDSVVFKIIVQLTLLIHLYTLIGEKNE